VQEADRRPVRSFQEWRPEPLLCKRFNVPDPYKGKPAVPASQAPRFKSDVALLLDTGAAATPPALLEAPQQVQPLLFAHAWSTHCP
jgi:G patch domain-containing protein 1